MNSQTIETAFQTGKYLKIGFKTLKAPKFGKIVKLADHEKLLEKHFVRFVSLSKLEGFHEAIPQRKEGFTLLLNINDIKVIFPTDNI